MINQNSVEKSLSAEWAKYSERVEQIGLAQFNKYVIPYLQKFNYTFRAGNGGWIILDAKKERPFIPKWIRDFLETRIDGMDANDIGSLMPDYPRSE